MMAVMSELTWRVQRENEITDSRAFLKAFLDRNAPLREGTGTVGEVY